MLATDSVQPPETNEPAASVEDVGQASDGMTLDFDLGEQAIASELKAAGEAVADDLGDSGSGFRRCAGF